MEGGLFEVPFSDHLGLSVKLRFTKENGDLDLKKPETYIATSDLRAAATSEEVKDILERDPTVLKEPLIK